MAARLSRHLINLDLFTDAYRVTGSAMVGTSGLHGELGNPNTSFLKLEDAYISRIHQPGEIVASYKTGAFRKDNINFIILQNRRDGIPMSTQHARSIYSRGRPANVFLTVPSFEIQGEIQYSGKMEPREILVQTLGNFQPIFEAKASASIYPDISYSGDLILVHKERIGIFCLDTNQS